MSYEEIRDAFMMGAEEIERLRKLVKELGEQIKTAERRGFDAARECRNLYDKYSAVQDHMVKYKTFEDWKAENKTDVKI